MDELQPDLEALLDAERARPPMDDDARARLRARVGLGVGLGVGAAALGVGLGKGSAVKAWLATKWIVLLAFLSGGVVGFGVRGVVAPRPIYVPVGRDVPPMLAPSASVLPIAASVAPPVVVVASASVVKPVAAKSAAVPSASSSAAIDASAEEARLVETARTALVRGNSADALIALDAHSTKYPSGERAEEREALAVQALVKAGRADDARARAERFKKGFPGSIYLGAVNASIASLPP